MPPPPPPLRGTPYFVILRETQSPEKISWQPVITRLWEVCGGVSDCEELVGIDQGAKYETLS